MVGNFNAKGLKRDSPTEDYRGQVQTEWLCKLNLNVLNKGNTPTWIRGNQFSLLDVTIFTGRLVCKIKTGELNEKNKWITRTSSLRLCGTTAECTRA